MTGVQTCALPIFLSGVMAKEVIIGSIGTLYGLSADNQIISDLETAKTENRVFDWWSEEIIKNFFSADIINFLNKMKGHFQTKDQAVHQFNHDSNDGAITEEKAQMSDDYQLSKLLKQKFANYGSVFAYLLFILLYFPCVSVFTATSKEIGQRYAIISGLWTTSLAYCVATVFYQIYQFLEPLLHKSNHLLILVSLTLCVFCVSSTAFAIVGFCRKIKLF